MEGYANLEHWVAELDNRIEEILLQRLANIIQLFCSEFDRTDEGDIRRDTVLRDITNKRRNDKKNKDEKVWPYVKHIKACCLDIYEVHRWKLDTQTYHPRDKNSKSSHISGSTH